MEPPKPGFSNSKAVHLDDNDSAQAETKVVAEQDTEDKSVAKRAPAKKAAAKKSTAKKG